MILAIPFPEIDPVIVQFGGLAIRWYGLAYVVGLLLGWRYCLRLATRPPHLATVDIVDDFFVWAVLGVVAGGRLGSVLFYNFDFYLSNPLEILFIWRGGMSFKTYWHEIFQ
jgi:phosphatidylglycerol:prolipoprotein diacylglycerol transferase